ncbi:MAG: 50S ribosomal protein L14 [Candidatus Nealsonbacteria bacterium]|nr:MAG: 50S ribosomal protein L14 [Candidatus Nealsonbacteria bacterium]
MIQVGTKLNVADNSGAKVVQCFNIPGGTRKRYARIGDIIVGVVKKAEPRKEVKTHDIVRAVIVRQRQPYRRKDGTYIKFDDNACCILADNKNPKGNRILGPVPRELKEKGFDKIATLAEEIV